MMEINDKMKHYIERALAERIDKAYPNSSVETRKQTIDSTVDIILMTATQNPDLLYLLRALELACEGVEE